VQKYEERIARAWYIKYPGDAYALGPLRFSDPVTAITAINRAIDIFGEPPVELWPQGEVEEVPRYVVTLLDPESGAQEIMETTLPPL
jgi:hypothetical protein